MSENGTKEENDVRIELNDRQKKILQEVGLSQNPSELSYGQQRSIVEIERMLVYLENKYDKSFRYLGYSNGLYEKRWLTACVEGTNSDTITVTVSREGKYVDDYPWVFHRKIYDALLKEQILRNSEVKRVKVFSETGGADLQNIEKLSLEEIKGHILASTAVFIFDCEEGTVKEISNMYKSWCTQNKFSGSCVIGSIDDESIWESISRMNHERYIHMLKWKTLCKTDHTH